MTEIQTIRKAIKIISEKLPGEIEIVSQLNRLAAEKLKPGNSLKEIKRFAENELKHFKQFQ